MAKQDSKSGKYTVWKVVAILAIIVVVLQALFALISFDHYQPRIASGGSGAKVAVVPLVGPIVTERSGGLLASGAEVSSQHILDILEDIQNDKSVDAVVFHINSPGGYVVPSHKIAKAINELDVPTVSIVEDVAASGAYWVASATDHIIADDFSMTGSIGVIASYLNFGEFIDQYNVTYERLVAGEYKDMGVPFKELTPAERQILQQELDTLHEAFITSVARNRNLSVDHVRDIADGRVYLGINAIDLGLVDQLGGFDEVQEHLKKELGVSRITYISYQQQNPWFSSLFSVRAKTPFDLVNEGFVPQLR